MAETMESALDAVLAKIEKGEMLDPEFLQAVINGADAKIEELEGNGCHEKAVRIDHKLCQLEKHDPLLGRDIKLPKKIETVLKPEDKASGMPSWLYFFLPALGRGSMPIGWLYVRVRGAAGLPGVVVNGDSKAFCRERLSALRFGGASCRARPAERRPLRNGTAHGTSARRKFGAAAQHAECCV